MFLEGEEKRGRLICERKGKKRGSPQRCTYVRRRDKIRDAKLHVHEVIPVVSQPEGLKRSRFGAMM